MLGLGAVPAIIQFIGFLYLPESPRWLIRHGHDAKAREVLERMHSEEEALIEYGQIQLAEEEHTKLLRHGSKGENHYGSAI